MGFIYVLDVVRYKVGSLRMSGRRRIQVGQSGCSIPHRRKSQWPRKAWMMHHARMNRLGAIERPVEG